MFHRLKVERARTAAVQAVETLLHRRTALERLGTLEHYALEHDAYFLGFLAGYGSTLANGAIARGRLSRDELSSIGCSVLATCFPKSAPDAIRAFTTLQQTIFEDGLTLGAKAALLSLGLSLRDDDPAYQEALRYHAALPPSLAGNNLAASFIDKHFWSRLEDA